MPLASLCCGASGVADGGKSFSGRAIGEILLLGPEGAGKTVLVRSLASLGSKTPQPVNADAVSTMGTELYTVLCPKGMPVKQLAIREVGGCMLPLWPQYFSACAAVLYCMDVSDATMLAPGGMELYELLGDPRLAGRPVRLVLTKTDLPTTFTLPQLDMALGLQELLRLHAGRLSVVSLSSLQGPTQALQELCAWCATLQAEVADTATTAAAAILNQQLRQRHSSGSPSPS